MNLRNVLKRSRRPVVKESLTAEAADIPGFAMPPMKAPQLTENTVYHVGVSGGKDSAAALLWLVYESGIDPRRIIASFSDTKNEHQWTYQHIQMLSERVHPIKTLEPEFGFFDLALNKKRFPSPAVRFCTVDLKIVPYQNFITELFCQGLNPIAVSGVRADESIERSALEEWGYDGNLLVPQWRPLIAWTIDDVFAIHKRHNVPLNPLYAAGAQRVGCWPCIMSRKEEIRNIALHFPERIDEIRAAELAFSSRGGEFSSFFGPDKTPKRFHSRSSKNKAGEEVSYPTIDDVVRWAMTGKGAQGTFHENPEPERACKSGYCE